MFTLKPDLEENFKELRNFFLKDNNVKFKTFSSRDYKVKCGIVFTDVSSDKTVINENVIKPIVNSIYNTSQKNTMLCSSIENSITLCDEIEKTNEVNVVISSILEGKSVLFINSIQGVLILNTKGGRLRNIALPPSENVVRGPREGFTESILINMNLIRKRIQDPNLKVEFKEIGRRTKTKVCIAYIQDIAPEKVISEITKRIDKIDIDGILDSGYIEELIRDQYYSPFKTIGTTERPDVAVSKLLEGRVIVICDGTPFTLSMPFIFVEFFQANEDYYSNYVFASLNRILRIVCFILTTSTPAIYVALISYHQEMIPTSLFMSIAASREGVPFPSVLEAVLMLIVFEILREAGVRLPKQIGQAISIVGALVLGEAAVSARFMSAPIVIIIAITGISGFVIPQMLEAIIILRFVFLGAASALGLYGYIFAIIGLFTYLMSMHSFGVNYMEYVDIIGKENIKDTAIRVPHWHMKYRPRFVKNNKIRVGHRRKA